jgi:flagellar biosynthesis/type III secretory pathway M-ring protein FliF/YscJ
MWNLTDIKEWIIDTKDNIVWKWQDLSKKNKIVVVGILALAIWVICTLI